MLRGGLRGRARRSGADQGARSGRSLPRPRISPSTRRSLIALGVIVLIAVLVYATSSFWVNWWWFGSMGYRSVIVTRYLSEWGMAILFGVLTAAFFLANAVLALRRSRAALVEGGRTTSRTLDRILLPLLLVLGAVVFVLNASVGWSNWEKIRLFAAGGDFGIADPVYGRDAGFYVFALPVLELVRSTLTTLLLVTGVTVALIYLLRLGLSPRNLGSVPRVMRTHVLTLAGALLLVVASWFWLANYELVYSTRGVVLGASFTDINVQRWTNWILVVLTAAIAILLIANGFVNRVRLLVLAVGAWVVLAGLLGFVVPFVVQQAVVNPSEYKRERGSIEDNIAMTRASFAIADVESRELSGQTPPTAADVAAQPETIDNIRLWDYRVIQETIQKNKQFAPYYVFPDVDVDRYGVDTGTQQVLTAGRELDVNNLPETAQTWTNTHLTYTHGYGVVVSPVNGVSRGGQPAYIVSEIATPPFGPAPYTIAQPQIYFGESTSGWVIVRTDQPEFDGLIGGGDEAAASAPYAGTAAGSIGLGNTATRLISAIYLRDRNVFLSGALTNDSRLILRRDVTDRIGTIAPFLSLDPDPYLVIVDGRLFWIVDAYTSTDRFPGATRFDGVNYMRNSVKVVVDAYNGDVTFYRTGVADPIADAYGDIYGDLFTPIDQAPAGIAAHFRYPERLFNLQAEAMGAYHVTDPRLFYDSQERWVIAQEQVGGTVQQMVPYYVTMRLPGEQLTDFTLILPFTPGGRQNGQNNQNMTAWMAARADTSGAGSLVVYRFPRQESVDGPRQVEARIDQDPDISSQITLWSQSGSEVIRGNLLVIPLETGNLYVQPLYLRATSSEAAYPELQRVIVATSERVAMAPTFDAALAAAIGEGTTEDAATTSAPETPAESGAAPSGAPEGGSGGPPSEAQLAQEALAAFERANAARAGGDFVTYEQELQTVQALLQQMAGTSGAAATPAASPGDATPEP